MDDIDDHGPSRRTVLTGAAAVGMAWTVPVVLSGSPAAAQASGCALLGATATGVCTGNPSLPYGMEFSVTLSGCPDSPLSPYAVAILEGGVVVACLLTSASGGFVGRLLYPGPVANVTYSVRLHQGSCDNVEIGSTTAIGTTPTDCDTAGSSADTSGTTPPGT